MISAIVKLESAVYLPFPIPPAPAKLPGGDSEIFRQGKYGDSGNSHAVLGLGFRV